jgi:hypothetical protein
MGEFGRKWIWNKVNDNEKDKNEENVEVGEEEI